MQQSIDCIYQNQLRQYLDKLTITPENIGEIRRSLFVPYDGIWNSVVRDETASREKPDSNECRLMQNAVESDYMTQAVADSLLPK